MRNLALEQALKDFTEEAAWQLAADAADGEAVPFEVVEEARGANRTPLYCYRPLSSEFIASRIGKLARLPTYAAAAAAITATAGVEEWLTTRGERRVPRDNRDLTDMTLRLFLQRIWEDTDEFVFERTRFDRAYAELEACAYEGRSVTVVLTPVLGLVIESDEIAIGEGLALVRGNRVPDAPAEAMWAEPEADRPSVLAVLTVESEPGDLHAVAGAHRRFRRLLTALRLFDHATVALGPAWLRMDGGPWTLAPLGGGDPPEGERLVVRPDEEDELRGFVNLVGARLPAEDQLAWALNRFELARERRSPWEALTDDLLALRALLEPEGPQTGRLAQRLAALCATAEDRSALAERVAKGIGLERAIVAGLQPDDDGARGLATELTAHLRALLRDVVCGHLEPDLVGVADGMLNAALDAVVERRSAPSTPAAVAVASPLDDADDFPMPSADDAEHALY